MKKGDVDKSKDITKKLQKLAKSRKTHKVITERGSVKYRNRSSSTSTNDYYSSYSENN